MLLSEFDYHLPEELIAQTPCEPRNASRLMVLDPQAETIEHHGRPSEVRTRSGRLGGVDGGSRRSGL